MIQVLLLYKHIEDITLAAGLLLQFKFSQKLYPFKVMKEFSVFYSLMLC